MAKKQKSRRRQKRTISDEDAKAMLAGFFSQLFMGFVALIYTNPRTKEGVHIVQDMIRDAGVRGAKNYRKIHQHK